MRACCICSNLTRWNATFVLAVKSLKPLPLVCAWTQIWTAI